jgi:hypothetical protein
MCDVTRAGLILINNRQRGRANSFRPDLRRKNGLEQIKPAIDEHQAGC